MWSRRSRLRLPSHATLRCSGRPSFGQSPPGPSRTSPPFVAMRRSLGYGCSAPAINSSLVSGPYESAVSTWLTPSSTARRRTACAVSTSSGRPQMPGPVRRIAPKPRRFTSSSPAIAKVPEAVAVGMAGGLPSEHGQVALELPGADLHAVVLPLLALDLDVAVEHVLAERAQDELGFRRDLDRLAERLRQLLDPEPPPVLGRQVVEVLLHRLGQLVALLAAFEPRLQERGERQVRVARRIRTAELHARRLPRARVVERHADERAAVAPRPREVDGRLVAGDQALVAVHPLGEDRADLP